MTPTGLREGQQALPLERYVVSNSNLFAHVTLYLDAHATFLQHLDITSVAQACTTDVHARRLTTIAACTETCMQLDHDHFELL